MSHRHHHNHHDRDCKPRYFHDTVGQGTLDSTPIRVPPDFNAETGTSLNPDTTIKDNTHPGPFAGQSFHPSSQEFSGILPRRHTPNKSPEKAGKVIMNDKKHGRSRFYKPKVKNVH